MLVLGIILLVLAAFFLVLTLAANDDAGALLSLMVAIFFALGGLAVILSYKNTYNRVYCIEEAGTYYVDTLVTRKICGDVMSSDTIYIIHYKTPNDIKREQKIHKDGRNKRN